MLTLQTEDTDVRFQTRLIDGVDPANVHKEPGTIILDGQQRLTLLFQALILGNVVFQENVQRVRILI